MSTHSQHPDDLTSTPADAGEPPGDGPTEEILTISGAGDALALVAHTFGFLPVDSLVVVGLHGGRTGAHLRIDLGAGVDHPDGLAEWVCDHLAGPRTSPRPDGAVVYLFTDEAPAPPGWDDPSLRPYAALHASLTAALRVEHGIQVAQSWWIGGGHIRDYDCHDARCCPFPGEDVQTAADSVLHAHMVYRGRSLRTPQQTVEDFLLPPTRPSGAIVETVVSEQLLCAVELAELPSAHQALWDWEGMIRGEVRARELEESRQRFGHPVASEDEWIEAWFEEHCDELAMMTAALSWGDLRDALLVLAADGLEVAAMTVEVLRGRDGSSATGQEIDAAALRAASACQWAGQAEGLEGAPGQDTALPSEMIDDHRRLIEAHLGRFRAVLLGATGERPAWERLDALAVLLSRLQPLLGAEAQAETLALMSWIEWARGRGTLYGVYLDRCLAMAPEHPLGRVMRVDHGIGRICPWAMVREHSWSSARADP